MKITLEMVLTKFFAEFNNTKLLTSISDAQMQHALQGIQLLPRHMHSLSGDYLYVTDQFYYSAEICKDSGTNHIRKKADRQEFCPNGKIDSGWNQ